jgi:hypothetical protein
MQKKLRRIALFVVILSAVCIVAGYFYFKPMPIVSDPSKSKIIEVQVTDINDKNGALIKVKNYNEAEILNYLSTCKERRMLEIGGIYQQGQVAVELAISAGTEFKIILLGDINYRFAGANTQKYEILDSKEVKSTILDILNTKSTLSEIS